MMRMFFAPALAMLAVTACGEDVIVDPEPPRFDTTGTAHVLATLPRIAPARDPSGPGAVRCPREIRFAAGRSFVCEVESHGLVIRPTGKSQVVRSRGEITVTQEAQDARCGRDVECLGGGRFRYEGTVTHEREEGEPVTFVVSGAGCGTAPAAAGGRTCDRADAAPRSTDAQ